MSSFLSADKLAKQVNQWCDQHRIVPANGQVGNRVTERNVRYYRSLGLLDPPLAGGGGGFGEKHLLQLIAMRLLQAQGLPLNRIRQLLSGRTPEELKQIQEQGLAEWQAAPMAGFRPLPNELWGVSPLDDEYLIISRRGEILSAELQERLLAVLHGAGADRGPAKGSHERNANGASTNPRPQPP